MNFAFGVTKKEFMASFCKIFIQFPISYSLFTFSFLHFILLFLVGGSWKRRRQLPEQLGQQDEELLPIRGSSHPANHHPSIHFPITHHHPLWPIPILFPALFHFVGGDFGPRAKSSHSFPLGRPAHWGGHFPIQIALIHWIYGISESQ
jgi:hypothetical protein